MLDWIVDCGYAPHLIVDASSDLVQVPRQFVKEGRIVLNISASATQSFQIGAAAVEFSARFSGVSHRIRVPVEYVLGIYARETGQGMVFTEEPGNLPAEANASSGGDEDPPEPPAPAPDRPKRPSLKVVK
jgi:stringent starvation protein B